MVQLHHDEEMEPMHGMYGTLAAELEVQCTINRAELMAFLCLFRKAFGLPGSCGQQGIIDWALERRNEVHWPKSEGRRRVDVDLGRGAQNSSRRIAAGSRARRSTSHQEGEERNELFEKFVTEVNVKADDLAKDGAMMDGGGMAQIRATTVQQKREEVHAALQCAASFFRFVEDWHDCAEVMPKPKYGSQEWCAAASDMSLHELRREQEEQKNARDM